MQYTDKDMVLCSQIAYEPLGRAYKELVTENQNGKTKFSIKELMERAKQNGEDVSKLSFTDDQEKWAMAGIYDDNDDSGLYACVIETSDNNAVLAFRGSEDMKNPQHLEKDWLETNLGLLNSTLNPQQKEIRYMFSEQCEISKLLKSYDNLAFTGHSLGGNLADYAAIISPEYGLDDKLKYCLNLDGPGFSNEFLEKYENQIDKVSGKMRHVRWSMVGNLLFEVPGVKSEVGSSSSEHPFYRHDLKTLEYVDGYIKTGEEDFLAGIIGKASRGIEHMPTFVGNFMVDFATALVTVYIWGNHLLKNNKLLADFLNVFLIGLIAIMDKGFVVAVIKDILFLGIVIIGSAYAYEAFIETMNRLVDYFAKKIDEMCYWTKEQIRQFQDYCYKKINELKHWYNKSFNKGYQYSINHPYISVNCDLLEQYACRLSSINKRLQSLEKRIDSLYWQVGLLDLWNLMKSDLKVGYSWRLNKCSEYLIQTSNDFNNAEKTIISR